MTVRLAGLIVASLVAVSCAGAGGPELQAVPTEVAATTVPAPTPEATAVPAHTPTPRPETVTIEGSVISAADGLPVPGANVSVGSMTVTTDATGSFVLADVVDTGEVSVDRPVWHPATVPSPRTGTPVVIALEPIVVRALRVSQQVASDPGSFDALLALADDTVVNTLVFDTKDESDFVLYETDVAFAHELDSVSPVYDPGDLLAKTKAHDLYTVTRIVTFEDPRWVRAVPEAALAGHWVDAANPDNWHYPLDLAVEACQLGFDEVQFDYVRFPSGDTAERAWELVPSTSEERSEAIASFLAEARGRLHPMGCGVSAAIFGIVMSSADDERLGQTPETISAVVDAVSPMLYPSHYSPGWLGFADPNDHPGPVVAYALDEGRDRMAAGSLMRPWIQGFYYNGDQVRAQIDEAEARGAGWIIWNAFGDYRRDWLPSS